MLISLPETAFFSAEWPLCLSYCNFDLTAPPLPHLVHPFPPPPPLLSPVFFPSARESKVQSEAQVPKVILAGRCSKSSTVTGTALVRALVRKESQVELDYVGTAVWGGNVLMNNVQGNFNMFKSLRDGRKPDKNLQTNNEMKNVLNDCKRLPELFSRALSHTNIYEYL